VIDSFAAAVIAAGKSGPTLRVVLHALSKNERNRLMKKGEKTIISSDEAEFIHALSIASKWRDALPLSEKHAEKAV
jgi:hypothetical protein